MLYSAPADGKPKPVSTNKPKKEKVAKVAKEKVAKEKVKVAKVTKQKAAPKPKKIIKDEPAAPPSTPEQPEQPEQPEHEPAHTVQPEPVQVVQPEPLHVAQPAGKKSKKHDADAPPSWFVTFIKNTKKQEVKMKQDGSMKQERAPQAIAEETWKDDFKRQRIEAQSDQHMKQMHNLYNQMFYR